MRARQKEMHLNLNFNKTFSIQKWLKVAAKNKQTTKHLIVKRKRKQKWWACWNTAPTTGQGVKGLRSVASGRAHAGRPIFQLLNQLTAATTMMGVKSTRAPGQTRVASECTEKMIISSERPHQWELKRWNVFKVAKARPVFSSWHWNLSEPGLFPCNLSKSLISTFTRVLFFSVLVFT